MCFRCLNTFNIEKSIASHHDYCKSYENIKIELPEEGFKISFKNHNRSMRVPFIVYADFKSFTPQLSTCQPNPENRYTNQYQKHIPRGFCYDINWFDDTLNSQKSDTFVKEFSDDDVAEIFMDTLEKNIKEIYKKYNFQKDMIMTRHDKLVYDNSTNCYICNEELGEDRVRYHCHLSGTFRGSAHEVCNLKYMIQRFSQWYFTICLATTVTYLLKRLEIAKVIFLVYEIMMKTTFLSRSRSSLINLLLRKEER